MSGETFIPVLLVPVLKSYLNHTLTKRDKRASAVAKQEAKFEWHNARRRYIKIKNPFNRFDVMDAINSGYSQGVKR